MSAKIQFSWKNQKGYGLALMFYGWALLILTPALVHSFLIINLGNSQEDILLYLGLIIGTVAISGGLIASTYENLFDPLSKSNFINFQTLIIICLLIFNVFYLLGVPFIETLEPYLAIPRTLDIQGWTRFIISLISGIIGLAIMYLISEKRVK